MSNTTKRDGQRGSATLPLPASAGEVPAAALAQPSAFPRTDTAATFPSRALALCQAAVGSTLHRLYRGEGALLAINFSLIALHTASFPQRLSETLVSVLTIVAMYAFNDAYDAPGDLSNPRKDHELAAAYVAYRRSGMISILVLKLATAALAFATLSPRAAAAAAAVMVVNLIYSTLLKGVPLVDVLWCGLWGALYAAILTGSMQLLVLVGIMTAICHLYQTLNDRETDLKNGIVTTAVRSSSLSTNVIVGLSAALALALYAPLGVWASSAVTPVVLYFAVRRAGLGWLLSKAYFAAVWLVLLGNTRAAG